MLITFKLLIQLTFTMSTIFELTSAKIPDTIPGHSVIGDYPRMNMESCGYNTIESEDNLNETIESEDNLNETMYQMSPRIIDGEMAEKGDFPWMVSIHYNRFKDTYLCGGTIISDYWILTVSYCLMKGDNELDVDSMSVYVGSLKKYAAHVKYPVLQFFLHPFWNLALLRVKKKIIPVKLGNRYLINGVCLPRERIFNREVEDTIASGFGWIDSEDRPPNDVLRMSLMNIDDLSTCLRREYSEFHFCGTEDHHMFCRGDGGSPLVQFVDNRAVIVGTAVGVRTFRPGLCNPGYIYGYRISYFISWLKSYIENDVTTRSTPIPTTTTIKPSTGDQSIAITTITSTMTALTPESESNNSCHQLFISYSIFSVILLAIVFNVSLN